MHTSQQEPRKPAHGAFGAPGFARRATLAASIMLAGASASSLPSCSGRVAGDERAYWVPAYTFSAGSGGVSVSRRFAGMESATLYGVTSYYGRCTDIPDSVSGHEERLTGLIFRQLSGTFDFSSSLAASMLGNDVLVFMTDPHVWPNAIFAKDFAAAYEFQILDLGGTSVSDCRKGPCVIRDLLAINNKDGFFPDTDDIESLTPPQKAALESIAYSVGEELLHDYWQDGLDAPARAQFITLIRGMWRAGSLGQDDDLVLAGAWKTGGSAYALAPDGQVHSYSLRPYVLDAIASACPGCAQDIQNGMEIAVAVYLELFGEQADSLVGNSPRSYYEYYIREDQAEGKPAGTYGYYADRFIERESFSHLGAPGPMSRTVPSFFRPLFAPICTQEHLDSIFSDGSQSPAISQNPYLNDSASFITLIQSVMPLVMAQAKGG